MQIFEQWTDIPGCLAFADSIKPKGAASMHQVDARDLDLCAGCWLVSIDHSSWSLSLFRINRYVGPPQFELSSSIVCIPHVWLSTALQGPFQWGVTFAKPTWASPWQGEAV